MPRNAHSTNTPYMEVADMPRLMKGGPLPTVFGVLGMVQETAPQRSVGGLVITSTHPSPSGKKDVRKEKMLRAEDVQTERGTLCAPSKTKVPGAHFSMTPFAGAYMSHEGHKL